LARTWVFSRLLRVITFNARIHRYEPNANLALSLSQHSVAVGAEYFLDAVRRIEGQVSLRLKEDSLPSIVECGVTGSINQISLSKAVERLGEVDLLKLDCEGAEWSIFSDPDPWSRIRSLTMESHLWVLPGATTHDLKAQLGRLGFVPIEIEPSINGSFGFARASRL
jgi:hypothetical protein